MRQMVFFFSLMVPFFLLSLKHAFSHAYTHMCVCPPTSHDLPALGLVLTLIIIITEISHYYHNSSALITLIKHLVKNEQKGDRLGRRIKKGEKEIRVRMLPRCQNKPGSTKFISTPIFLPSF